MNILNITLPIIYSSKRITNTITTIMAAACLYPPQSTSQSAGQRAPAIPLEVETVQDFETHSEAEPSTSSISCKATQLLSYMAVSGMYEINKVTRILLNRKFL